MASRAKSDFYLVLLYREFQLLVYKTKCFLGSIDYDIFSLKAAEVLNPFYIICVAVLLRF